MKKLSILLALLLAMSLVFCGCSDNGDGKKESKKSETNSESVAEKDENKGEEADADGDSSDNGEASTDSDDAEKDDFDSAVDDFKAPSETKKIDTDKEDPSTKDMTFTYDDEGRVKSCIYKVDGKTYMASYSYKENSATIYTFYGDTVIDTAEIKISDYDPSKGFAVIDGYYFKGYTKG